MKYFVFTEQSLLAFIENLTEEKIKTGIFRMIRITFVMKQKYFQFF